MEEPPFSEKTLAFLQNRAIDDGAIAYLKAAFEIDIAISSMCFVRNGLDRKDPKYGARYTFMEGAIKIMKEAGQKHFDQGCSYAKARQLDESGRPPST